MILDIFLEQCAIIPIMSILKTHILCGGCNDSVDSCVLCCLCGYISGIHGSCIVSSADDVLI